MTDTPTLYVMRASAPCRIAWWSALLAGYEVELKDVDLSKGEHKTEEYVKMNPRHCVPTLKAGDFVLTESRAIAEYVLDKGQPKQIMDLGAAEAAVASEIRELLYYDIGIGYKRIGEYIYPRIFHQQPFDEEKRALVHKTLEYLEGRLGDKDYLVGEQAALCDLSIAVSLTMLEFDLDFDSSAYPKVQVWQQRMAALPHWHDINKPFRQWVASCAAQGE